VRGRVRVRVLVRTICESTTKRIIHAARTVRASTCGIHTVPRGEQSECTESSGKLVHCTACEPCGQSGGECTAIEPCGRARPH
jgi:hypothetical protein